MTRTTTSTARALAALLALGAAAACAPDSAISTPGGTSGAAAASTGMSEDASRIRYGRQVQVGNGHARSYVLLDEARQHPIEIGVALTETALDGLPSKHMAHDAADGGGAHGGMTEFLLDLPKDDGTPYQFVELDWNAMGHEPAGVYDKPHFDFHFYTIDLAARNAIVPSNPAYATEAANLPAPQFRFPFYVDPITASGGAPAAAVAVPRMGMHWLDVRSPEIQGLLGNPAGYREFTKTFIYGSWNGAFTFAEPMITRTYIVAKRTATDPAVRDEVTPIPTAGDYAPSGLYPGAYRIAWNAGAKEYRIALTQLAWHE